MKSVHVSISRPLRYLNSLLIVVFALSTVPCLYASDLERSDLQAPGPSQVRVVQLDSLEELEAALDRYESARIITLAQLPQQSALNTNAAPGIGLSSETSAHRSFQSMEQASSNPGWDPDLVVDLAHVSAPSGDLDAIVFVVVGLVVVVVFVAYGLTYLYRLARASGDLEYWWDLDLHSSWLLGREESGHFSGARLTTGYLEQKTFAGLSLEAGYFDIELETSGDAEDIEARGSYGLIGPHLHWEWNEAGGNPSRFFMELLAGTTSSSEIDLLSMARMGLSFGLGERTRLGLTVGSMYIDLELDEGITRDVDDFSLILGTDIGIRF